MGRLVCSASVISRSLMHLETPLQNQHHEYLYIYAGAALVGCWCLRTFVELAVCRARRVHSEFCLKLQAEKQLVLLEPALLPRGHHKMQKNGTNKPTDDEYHYVIRNLAEQLERIHCSKRYGIETNHCNNNNKRITNTISFQTKTSSVTKHEECKYKRRREHSN